MFLHSMCYVVGVRVVAYIIICIYGAPKHMQSCQFLFQVSSGHQEIDDINRFRVPENLEKRDMTVHYVDGSGKNRICGGSDLKGSQAYPVQTFVSRADMFLVSFPRKHQSNFCVPGPIKGYQDRLRVQQDHVSASSQSGIPCSLLPLEVWKGFVTMPHLALEGECQEGSTVSKNGPR